MMMYDIKKVIDFLLPKLKAGKFSEYVDINNSCYMEFPEMMIHSMENYGDIMDLVSEDVEKDLLERSKATFNKDDKYFMLDIQHPYKSSLVSFNDWNDEKFKLDLGDFLIDFAEDVDDPEEKKRYDGPAHNKLFVELYLKWIDFKEIERLHGN